MSNPELQTKSISVQRCTLPFLCTNTDTNKFIFIVLPISMRICSPSISWFRLLQPIYSPTANADNTNFTARNNYSHTLPLNITEWAVIIWIQFSGIISNQQSFSSYYVNYFKLLKSAIWQQFNSLTAARCISLAVAVAMHIKFNI